MSPERGCPFCPSLVCPTSSPVGRRGWGTAYQRKSPALGATLGALEGDACLGGVLSVAISKMPLEWGLRHGMYAPRSKKLHPFFATSARAKSSRRGQQRTLLPRSRPQGAGGGGGGGRCSGERSSGESPDKVSCTVVGEAAQPALPVGVHFGGKVGGGGPSYL